MAETTDELEHQRLWERGDLVIRGFRRLSIKYRSLADQHHDDLRAIQETLSTFSSDQAAMKQSILNQLQFHALPILHSQTTTLSHSLKPLGLQNEPESKFEILLDIHSEIETILDLINRLTCILYPQSVFAASRADDQHLNQFKSYRLRSLKAKFIETCGSISRVFREAHEVLEKMKHSPEESSQLITNTAAFSGDRSVDDVLEAIKWTITCINGNELDVAQSSWQTDLEGIHYLLHQIMALVNPESHSATQNQESRSKLSREPVLRLAESAIPLIKISKLFFTKLSTCGMNNQRLPVFTEMSSDQIECLANLLGLVTRDIIQLYCLFHEADEGAATGQDFVRIADKLKSRYEAPLVALLLYVVPSIPDTDDGFPTQSVYRTWFATWNTQRILATMNFINAAELLGANQS